jgi:putative cell wall-binding protein
MSWSRAIRAAGITLVAALVAVLAPIGAAYAVEATTTTTTTPITEVPMPDHTIVFPVAGEVDWTDTYGAPRSGGRTHEGQDLMGDKMQQLVATDDGEITYLKRDGSLAGHMLELTAEDGWVYTYLHLNNDTPGTDDGLATEDQVFGPGIELGAEVKAGQLLGYLGDSGNAEGTAPHLHFEMETPEGVTINAAPALLQASHVQPIDAPATQPDGDEDDEAAIVDDGDIPRLAGTDRITTAVAVSKEGWPSGATEAVLAAGDRYDEALPASVLAAAKRGPLLLTLGTTLPSAVQTELQRLGATKVTVIGSVPATVEQALAKAGRTVTRLGTPDKPVETAVAIAQAVGGSSGTAVLVNQQRFADGVSATSIAAGRGWPVLLTTTDVVPQQTVDAWRALGVTKLVVVGGTSVVAQKIEDFARNSGRCGSAATCQTERLAGNDRYATSVAVAQRSLAIGGRTTKTVLLGTGTAYPDVLASGPLAARVGGVSLLVDGTGSGADAAARSFLAASARSVDDVAILGGTGAVTPAAAVKLGEALGL